MTHSGPVFWCKGLVLNRDDISTNAVPRSYTAQQLPYPNAPESTRPHRWQIQGNDNARWLVELEQPAFQS